MKSIVLIALIMLTGCASSKLKRCVEPVTDEKVQHCPKHVDGPYYFCTPPSELFHCEDPS